MQGLGGCDAGQTAAEDGDFRLPALGGVWRASVTTGSRDGDGGGRQGKEGEEGKASHAGRGWEEMDVIKERS